MRFPVSWVNHATVTLYSHAALEVTTLRHCLGPVPKLENGM